MFHYFETLMIETVFFWLSIVFLIIYGIIYFFFWKGLNRTAFSPSPDLQNFSIIIAARNEETTIGTVLDSLSALDYPKDKFEVIVVDDRSTDSTSLVLDRYRRTMDNLHVVAIKENNSDMPNKKNALRTAIDRSRFDILALTDADCIVPPQWLRELSKAFSPETGAVAGYSPVQNVHKDWLSSFVTYDEMKNSLIAAAAVGLQSAFMCTGRNFSYRKEVYKQVGGFEKIKHSISGDDDLFLQLVRKETAWRIRYMTAPESAVATYPPESMRQFVNQRIRHVSASAYYPFPVKAVFASFHLLLLAALGLCFLQPLYGLIVFVLRINCDAVMVARGKEIFGSTVGVVAFFRNELFLLLYPLIIGPLSFVSRFEWKGTGNR